MIALWIGFAMTWVLMMIAVGTAWNLNLRWLARRTVTGWGELADTEKKALIRRCECWFGFFREGDE